MWFDDGTRRCIVAFEADTASTFKVGIIGGGGYVTGGTQLNRDQFYEIIIRKNGNGNWQLYIDGALVESVGYTASFATVGTYRFVIGHIASGATSNRLQVKQISVWVHTVTDYWSARGTGGVGTGGNQRLDVGSAFFTVNDIGKTIEISNAPTPINNGRFEILNLVSTQVARLVGPLNPGLIAQSGGNPLRVEVDPAGQLFQYPDDIGKKLVISGSVSGNDGVYTVGTLLQPGTLQDLSSGATPVPEKTYIAEVTAASFVPETNLNWRLTPAFTVESPVDWEMSDASSWTGTTLTLRQALPLSAAQCYRVLEVIYSNVLSAQILLNSLIENEVIQEVPDLLFSYYPFYLADPLGYVRSYLDTLTAAGVIPDFLVE
jgi:hypothetical protein